MSAPSRREELAANLAVVQARIAAAATAAGRDPSEITLIAVTKTYPAADIALLAELGVSDVGESRDQEAAGKAATLGDLPVRWHFVGQLQTNKARSVARYADVVHSVDRPGLVGALSRAAADRAVQLDALVQLNLDPADSGPRGGVSPAELPRLADEIAAAAGLRLRGLMLVAPPGLDPEPVFDRLARAAAALRVEHPHADWISAGMSGDLEVAVAHGATHVRVGSGLLGARPAKR
ncbi:MAG TPA: YggS family pyridoxal phosphate-dependent enzyme [Sporichthyaceae bacterium]|nr:YggS family pyridoxal phosphate-dependent enzyme [Sporichthyaceae bacterium]